MITAEWSRAADDYGFYRLEVPFSGTSDPIKIMASMSQISVALHPSGGTARIEFTLSTPARVAAGTARWIAWPLGDLAAAGADALLSCVTAIRGVASTSAIMEVCAL